ncbi:MAG TPA: DNA polymerase III subunit epsilon [Lentisphaeria bacterium]|nr:MAG: DNA polymerase III subunit epsilon [Lentisphaerae bacterium GWF2_49_21]HBC89077.1 DNA polymerase III subunit epsilon [Lentisphaeria bacterium]
MEFNLPGFKFEKPIIFFDLETTGTNITTDRIVEISAAKLMPDGKLEVKTKKINPERPIPPEATAIHGIKDSDVANEPKFKSISSSLLKFFEGCDLAGYNINNFDLPLLSEEFRRAGLSFTSEGRKIIDVQTIFHKREPRNLSAAYKFFCGKELENAHSAEKDILATMEVFEGQLKKYGDLPNNIDELHLYCSNKKPEWIDNTGKFKWQGEVPVIGFGRNNGIPLKEIAVNNPNFLKWIINGAFPYDTVEIAKNALAGKFPVKNKPIE